MKEQLRSKKPNVNRNMAEMNKLRKKYIVPNHKESL